MTDSIQRSSEPYQPPMTESRSVSLKLPADIAAAIDRAMRESGQAEADVLLNALRSAFGLQPQPMSPSPPPVSSALWHQLVARVTNLEALAQRMEDLEGKLIAS